MLESNIQEYFNCKSSIFYHILKKTKDKELTEDIMQDLYLKVVSNVDKTQNIENLCGYMHRIADNLLIDYLRKTKAKEVKIVEFDAEMEQNLYEWAFGDIKTHIEKLPAKYQEAIRLVDIEGKPQIDVAKDLGLSYTGLKSRVQRGRVMLKESLLSCCPVEFDSYGNVVKCCGELV